MRSGAAVGAVRPGCSGGPCRTSSAAGGACCRESLSQRILNLPGMRLARKLNNHVFNGLENQVTNK